MKINQAFTILQRAGGIRAARIITENRPNMSRISLWITAWRLRRGVPVAKIIHKKWFYGLAFYTSRATLDPRPDTETLVAAVLSDIPNGVTPRILDLGTGTGCIIGAICKNAPHSTGIGIDISRGAVRIAKKNIRDLGLAKRIQIKRARFDRPNKDMGKFDIIVSNPPYIARGDARVDAGAMHDPARALYAADNGYAAYRQIAKYAKEWIKNTGKIYLEIGIDQAPTITQIFTDAKWEFVRDEKDLGEITRVLVFSTPRN